MDPEGEVSAADLGNVDGGAVEHEGMDKVLDPLELDFGFDHSV